jgi:hypothetical protein
MSKECTIKGSQITWTLNDGYVDASELGWAPGEVPSSIKIDVNIGNRMDFILVDLSPETFVYRQELGCLELTVYND